MCAVNFKFRHVGYLKSNLSWLFNQVINLIENVLDFYKILMFESVPCLK